MRYYMQKNKVMYFNHFNGVHRENFQKNKNLTDFFYEVSYNYDKDQKEFISTVEGKKYPIWGT